MFEIQREPRTYEPVKLQILNLVSTQNVEQPVAVTNYPLVNNQMISSMDQVALQVKLEINNIMKYHEAYFPELRHNERQVA